MKFFCSSRLLSLPSARVCRLVAAVWLCAGWAAATCCLTPLTAVAAAKKDNKKPGPGAALYRRAERSFARQKLADALTLLDRAEAAGGAPRADVLNLRGAILLRQNRYAEARQKFHAALAADPKLWVARYNLAEVDLQEGRYNDSRHRLAGVLQRAPKNNGGEARDFIQYKLLLADLLAGREEPVIRYLSEHRSPDARRPDAATCYLNAALAYHRGQTAEAERWQARARRGKAPAALRQLFAASFEKFGDRLAASGSNNGRGARSLAGESRTSRAVASSTSDASDETLAVVARGPGAGRRSGAASNDRAETSSPETPSSAADRRAESDAADSSDASSTAAAATPASVAMVQLLPAPPLARSSTRAASSASPHPLAGKARAEPSPAATAANPSEPPGAATPSIDDTLPSFRTGSGPTPLAAASSPTPTPRESGGGRPSSSSSSAAAATPAAPGGSGRAAATPSASPAAAKPSPTPAAAATPEPPTDAFNAKYEAAFVAFTKRDYPTALALLQEADTLQPGQADSANLRGLILARQRIFERAELEFKRAVQLDPTFWAAKFNLADLPFSYRNYGMARTRFEALLADIDPAQLPRETELTQFKIFLCLLLEGKEASARAWMARFKFEGATPARLYAQAALDFHDGNFARAVSWMDSAKKQFPPQLEALFAESFYRIGWLTNNPTALAQNQPPGGSAAATPPPDTTVDPPLELPTPVPTPAPPSLTLAVPSPSPEPEERGSFASPSNPSPTPALVAVATPTPSPSPAPTTAVAVATATAQPSPAASPSPTRTPSPVVVAASPPTPAQTAAAAAASPSVAGAPDQEDWVDRLVRVILPAFVLLYLAVTPFFMAAALWRRRQRRKARRLSVPTRRPSDNLARSTKV